MNVQFFSDHISSIVSPAAVIFVFRSKKKNDDKQKGEFPEVAKNFLPATQALIKKVLDQDFSCGVNQSLILYPAGEKFERLVLVGLGEREKFSEEKFSHSIGAVALMLQEKKIDHFSLMTPSFDAENISLERAVFLSVKAIQLAQYQFKEFREKKHHHILVKELTFTQIPKNAKAQLQSMAHEALIISDAMNFTRQYGDLPPIHATPDYLVGEAQRIAKVYKNIHCRILRKEDMERLGMGGILAVTRGSKEAPAFIVFEYFAGPKKENPVVFVGKGITFDSGGLNIKTVEGMIHEMKWDMSGGGAVLELIKVIAALGMKKNVVGLVPACENLLGDHAYKPGDIIRSMSKKTIEVLNTDAEGRIILADAFAYAKKYKPQVIVDFATLTGAAMVALGNYYSGVFTRDEKLYDIIAEAGRLSGEKVWRLPLSDEFTQDVLGEAADLINIGKSGRWGGASVAAAFLEQFALPYRFAHIDIAPTAWQTKARPWMRSGATGVGVHLGLEILRQL